MKRSPVAERPLPTRLLHSAAALPAFLSGYHRLHLRYALQIPIYLVDTQHTSDIRQTFGTDLETFFSGLPTTQSTSSLQLTPLFGQPRPLDLTCRDSPGSRQCRSATYLYGVADPSALSPSPALFRLLMPNDGVCVQGSKDVPVDRQTGPAQAQSALLHLPPFRDIEFSLGANVGILCPRHIPKFVRNSLHPGPGAQKLEVKSRPLLSIPCATVEMGLTAAYESAATMLVGRTEAFWNTDGSRWQLEFTRTLASPPAPLDSTWLRCGPGPSEQVLAEGSGTLHTACRTPSCRYRARLQFPVACPVLSCPASCCSATREGSEDFETPTRRSSATAVASPASRVASQRRVISGVSAPLGQCHTTGAVFGVDLTLTQSRLVSSRLDLRR